jgi:anti-sigma regulatory factor (Ser/Thr protein kinase)
MSNEVRLALRPVPSSSADARAFVDETLGQWQCDDFLDATRLLVSELVTNAVLHARTDVELVLRATRYGLRVEVRDHSASLPVVRHYLDEAMTGRGLALVEELAARWGVQQLEDGKIVWFELDEAPG